MHWIDPDCLPKTQGVVKSFITNRHGEVDGLVVSGANQTPLLVCTPPHLGAAIEAVVKIGAKISVRGIRPRGANIVAAVALTVADGETVVDDGPAEDDGQEARHGATKPVRMETEGAVALSLFGPKGELRGALLENGTVIRIGAKEAGPVAELLHAGARLVARGAGFETRHGRVIAAEEIGPDTRSLKPVKAPKKTDNPQDTKRRGGEPAHSAGPSA